MGTFFSKDYNINNQSLSNNILFGKRKEIYPIVIFKLKLENKIAIILQIALWIFILGTILCFVMNQQDHLTILIKYLILWTLLLYYVFEFQSGFLEFLKNRKNPTNIGEFMKNFYSYIPTISFRKKLYSNYGGAKINSEKKDNEIKENNDNDDKIINKDFIYYSARDASGTFAINPRTSFLELFIVPEIYFADELTVRHYEIY